MIIDIALGIVLAVLILYYLPVIVSLGVVAIIGILFLAIGGAVFYFVYSNEEAIQLIITIAILSAVLWVGAWISELIAKHTALNKEDVRGFLIPIILLIVATIVFFPSVFKWAIDVHEPQLLLYLIPLVGLWMWLLFKLSRLLKTRNAELVDANKEA